MAPSRWLRVGVLQWLGRLSYSWYLWHWPVIVIPLVALPDLGLPARLGLALGALALAHLTFHLIENPVRRGRLVPARRAALVIAGGLALSAAGVGFGAIWRGEAAAASRLPGQIRFAAAAADLPLIYRNGCSLPHLRVDIPDCSFGAVESARTIVLFGDSHAAQWFPALARIAETRRWRLTVFTKSECPVPEIDYVSAVLGRRYDECSAWRARAIERIRALHPLAVLMSSSYAYPVTDSEWSAGMKATLARLAAEGTRLVLIRDVPRPGFHVPTCLARANWPPGFERPAACSFPVADALNEDRFDAEHQAARTFAGQITIADLTDAICEPDTCRPEIASTVKYRDSNHLTATFVTQLSDVLQRYLP